MLSMPCQSRCGWRQASEDWYDMTHLGSQAASPVTTNSLAVFLASRKNVHQRDRDQRVTYLDTTHVAGVVGGSQPLASDQLVPLFIKLLEEN
jgi:hypothetical protein